MALDAGRWVIYRSRTVQQLFGGGVFVAIINLETGEIKIVGPLDKAPLARELPALEAAMDVLVSTQEMKGAEELQLHTAKFVIASLKKLTTELETEVAATVKS